MFWIVVLGLVAVVIWVVVRLIALSVKGVARGIPALVRGLLGLALLFAAFTCALGVKIALFGSDEGNFVNTLEYPCPLVDFREYCKKAPDDDPGCAEFTTGTSIEWVEEAAQERCAKDASVYVGGTPDPCGLVHFGNRCKASPSESGCAEHTKDWAEILAIESAAMSNCSETGPSPDSRLDWSVICSRSSYPVNLERRGISRHAIDILVSSQRLIEAKNGFRLAAWERCEADAELDCGDREAKNGFRLTAWERCEANAELDCGDRETALRFGWGGDDYGTILDGVIREFCESL